MTPKFAGLAVALSTALGSVSPALHAQTSPDVARAREAYVAVDYESTLSFAKAALEHGGNDRSTTGELYFLWALAAAALDRAEESREAFDHALIVNPELKVDRDSSPKIRAPYQEARGALIRTDGKRPLTVEARRREGKLELVVQDARGLVDGVELSTRVHPGQAFARQRFDAAPTRRVTVAPQGLEFCVRLVDRHGNVLHELGSEAAPERLAAAGAPPGSAGRARAPEADVNRTPYYVTAAALGALGVAAGAVSTAMYLRREAAARDWNAPGCEKPGSSRAEQCAKVDDRRRSAEHLSIGFAAAGGALLIGGVVTWLLAPTGTRASVAVDTTARGVVLGLSTTL